MNGYLFLLICPPLFALACILVVLSSYWIDDLYQYSYSILTYPQKIIIRSRFRFWLLTTGFFLCLIRACCLTSLSQCFYLLTASFFLLLVTITDFEQFVIFDAMLLPFAILSLPMLLLFQPPFINHLLAALGGGAGFLLLAICTRGAIGGGDIKLIAVLGLWLGTNHLLSIVLIGLCLGGFAAFFMLLTKQKKRRSFFAYGPYFALTALIFILLHPFP